MRKGRIFFARFFPPFVFRNKIFLLNVCINHKTLRSAERFMIYRGIYIIREVIFLLFRRERPYIFLLWSGRSVWKAVVRL